VLYGLLVACALVVIIVARGRFNWMKNGLIMAWRLQF
jgi:hypothetical protein